MLLAACLDLIHESFLLAACNNNDGARQRCVAAVRIATALATLPPDTAAVTAAVGQFLLEHHRRLATLLPFDQRLLWTSSRAGSSLCPPVVALSAAVDSSHACFLHNDYTDADASIQRLPAGVAATFVRARYGEPVGDSAGLALVYQDVLTNCSFVSSFLLVVNAGHASQLFLLVSSNGGTHFRVRLLFNGAPRLVDVDNSFPVLANSARNLTVRSASDPDLLWPAVIEKAVLKIGGNGYNFAGSNMAIDTYVLTGWLPEIIALTGGLPAHWDELVALKAAGDVLLGIGTGAISADLASSLNLISGHDYGVQTYADNNLTVVNPWLEPGRPEKRTIVTANINYFRYLYVNWKPQFAHVNTVHFIAKPAAGGPEPCQFAVTTHHAQEAWFLLEKHLPVATESVVHVAVYATTTGERVFAPTQYNRTAAADSNSRLVLVKAQLAPGAYTVVVSAEPATFTLKAYSHHELTLNKAAHLFAALDTVPGEWTLHNNGGNWSNSTYINNPQYAVVASADTELVLFLRADERALVNFHMFHCDDDDKDSAIEKFDKSKLLFNENYNDRFQVHRVRLARGHYKLVVSSYGFDTGKYQLYLNHAGTVSVSKISPSLGLFGAKHDTPWNGRNRFKLEFSAEHNTSVTFHISHYNSADSAGRRPETSADYRPALRASVFESRTSRPVQINEKWNASLYGVFVHCATVVSGRHILLVERFEMGTGMCRVEIGANKRVVIEE